MHPRIAIVALAASSIILTAASPAGLAAGRQRATTSDSSRTSVDWTGAYSGIVPCADCEGIDTTISLGEDLSCVVRTRYIGKSNEPLERKGSFTWDDRGRTITLQGIPGDPSRYLVGENVLIQLDAQGNRITGPLAARYVLRKSTNPPPAQAPDALFEPAWWRLTELRGERLEPTPGAAKVPSLRFVQDGSRVQGFAGCNDFNGHFEVLAGNRLRLGKIVSTLKACEDMKIESEFLQVLNTADSFHLEPGVLILHRARMAPLARFEAVARDPK